MSGKVILGYARLMRPANLPTAAADILAGAAIVSVLPEESDALWPVLLLVMASVCLYAGGVVLNDVFDFTTDKVERPERPIPSGLVSQRSAAMFGALWLLLGIFLALLTGRIPGYIAFAIAVFIVLYDSWSKKNSFLGPLNMGVCRGLNLLLGMSALGFPDRWEIAFIPVVYIFAITLISRGEVHGNNKGHLIMSAVLYAVVIAAISFLASGQFVVTGIFLALFALMVYRPLIAAYTENSPGNIRKAVIAGVLGLVLMDAALASAFAPWWYAVFIILLLPVSIGLSKMFAVT